MPNLFYYPINPSHIIPTYIYILFHSDMHTLLYESELPMIFGVDFKESVLPLYHVCHFHRGRPFASWHCGFLTYLALKNCIVFVSLIH